MSWVQLEAVELTPDGVYLPLELIEHSGKLHIFIPAFAETTNQRYEVGLFGGTRENPQLVKIQQHLVVSYDRYLNIDFPPLLPSPLLGLRLLDEGEQVLTTEPRVNISSCDHCQGSGGADGSGDRPVQLIESLLPRVPYLRSIRVPQMRRPTTIHRVGDEYWVFCFSSRAVRFSLSWNYLGEIGPQLGRPRPINQDIDRVWDVAIDPDRDRIYLSCATRHVVRCYRLSTFADSPELLDDIPAVTPGATSWPSSNASRPFEDGYLTFAGGVAVLPDGSLVIGSRQGTGGNLNGNFGAILHYSNQGDYLETIISRDGSGGLIQDLDYRDWYGKIRLENGNLWAVSFSQRMLISWSLNFTDGNLISLEEQYRRLFKPTGLPNVAGWTPYGFAFSSGEIVITQNANNGVNPGLYKGLYSLSLNDDSLQWFEGQQIELGEQSYGSHPALFSNPHDVLPIGFLGGREVYAVADYGDDKVSLIPRPEFIQDFLPYVTVPVLLSEGIEFVGPDDIVLDIASNSAQCPVYRLTPVIP